MKSKVLANQKIIRRYQYRSWYLMVILFFILVGLVLYLIRNRIQSPCPATGCYVKVVMAQETKPELQEIVDYILQVFAPSGREAQVKALACFISESGLRKDAYNWNPSSNSEDIGIGQVNLLYHPDVTKDQMYSWRENIQKSYEIYKSRGNFSAWYGWGCK